MKRQQEIVSSIYSVYKKMVLDTRTMGNHHTELQVSMWLQLDPFFVHVSHIFRKLFAYWMGILTAALFTIYAGMLAATFE